MKVELTCSECDLVKLIDIQVDADGVYSVPNKYCPVDLHVLGREVIVEAGAEKEEELEAEKEPELNSDSEGLKTSPVRPKTVQEVEANAQANADNQAATPDPVS